MNPLLASSPDDVSVLIPAHNEERFIGSVVLTALDQARRVVVVDDGSTDRTGEIARAAGAEVIRLDRQGGKGQALNVGFRYMRQVNAAVVVTLDGDAQHDPREIPIVAQPVVQGHADIVIGSRFLGVHSHIPWWRRIGQDALTWATNALSGAHVTDSQSGYRAFSARAVELMVFRTSGLSAESEMQFMVNDFDLNVVEVPVHVQYLDKSKRNPFWHGLHVVDAIMGLVARRHPLLLLAAPGVALILAGCLLGFDALVHVRTLGLPVLQLFATVVFLVSGVLLLLTGTILHSLEFFTAKLSNLLEDPAERRQSHLSAQTRREGSA
jgi:hypothetical protein